jgi:xylulokinase
MNQYLILVDIGGTFLKISKVGIESDKIKEFSKYSMPGFIHKKSILKELDPIQLLSMCLLGIQELLEDKRNVIGIYIAGQMGGWIATDKQNNPITNLITWQDQRILRIQNLYEKTLDNINEKLGPSWKMDSGNEERPGLPLISLVDYIQTQDFHIDFRFHTLISWVTTKLCDKPNFVLNITDFASTGIYNLRLNKSHFPEQYEKYVEFPKVEHDVVEIGFFSDTRIPVYSAVGDQQASLLGSGIRNDSLVINIGTGGQVAKLGGVQEIGLNQIRPYFDKKFLVTKTHLPSGRNITLFLEKILKRKTIDQDFKKFFSIKLNESSSFFGKDEIISLKDDVFNEIKEYLLSFSEVYLDSINGIGITDDTEIIFAGGVGQKMVYIQQFIANSLDNKISISETVETTLQGIFEIGKKQYEK